MIIGVKIGFKCLRGEYIPLTNANGTSFCGLIGLNGVGKSAVLEALSGYFNKNYVGNNIRIVYMFELEDFIQRAMLSDKEIEFVNEYYEREQFFFDNYSFYDYDYENYDDLIWKSIKKQCSGWNLKNKLIFASSTCIHPVNRVFDLIGTRISWSQAMKNELFWKNYNQYKSKESLFDGMTKKLSEKIRCMTTFVYVSKNITPEQFLQIGNTTLQNLIGTGLIDYIAGLLPMDNINKMTDVLRNFVEKFNGRVPNYNFKVPNKKRLPKLNANDIYRMIYDAFFSKLEFFQYTKGNINFSKLSTGEQNQVVLDFIYKVIMNYREDNSNLIIAVDEPESSFHISERFEQFNKLYEISKKGSQVFFASHWYGFIPAIPDGCVVNIVNVKGKRTFQPINIYKYKVDISRLKMPIDISMKGNLDLVQTIISSILLEDCYNWLICEGTSDKIYLEEYLKDEVKEKKLRIIPVGGCTIVEKIYMLLVLLLSDNDKLDRLKGKIFLLIDTDAKPTETKRTNEATLKLPKRIKDLNDKNKVWFRRLVNIEEAKKTILTNGVQKQDDIPTDIEGVLNGKVFNMVLNQFKDELSLEISGEEKSEDIPSAFLYSEESQKKALKAFFTPHNKVRFARAYVEEIQKGGYKEPLWITEIKNFFK